MIFISIKKKKKKKEEGNYTDNENTGLIRKMERPYSI